MIGPGSDIIDIVSENFIDYGLRMPPISVACESFPALIELVVGIDLITVEARVVVASIDFRQPPVAPYPASFQDIHYGIRWLKARAAELKSRPDRPHPLFAAFVRAARARAEGRMPRLPLVAEPVDAA